MPHIEQFMKPIEIENDRSLPSKLIEENHEDLPCTIPNFHTPDSNIK
jgi:hypothetical protein